MFSKILKLTMLVSVAGTAVWFAQPAVADECFKATKVMFLPESAATSQVLLAPSTTTTRKIMLLPESTATTEVMLAPQVIEQPVAVIERPVILQKKHFVRRSLDKLVNVIDVDDDDIEIEIDD